jgi:hypothetical protein
LRRHTKVYYQTATYELVVGTTIPAFDGLLELTFGPTTAGPHHLIIVFQCTRIHSPHPPPLHSFPWYHDLCVVVVSSGMPVVIET